ncbi:uncharacterized protein C8orf58 homolog [Sylvia borin]
MWGGSRAVWKRRFSCYGPWDSAESCIVRTSASVYRRLQESPRQPPRAMSTRGPAPPPPQPPSSPSAGGRFLKVESEDSGVEMTSNEHSPSTPLGSESSFSLDGFPAEKAPGEEPPRAPRSRSASRRLLQAAQRSRRQRCPRQLSRRSASAADLAEPPRDPEEPEGAAAGGARSPGSPRDPRAVPEAAVSGQGLRYLEHVCQMLERLARLQQDNRELRQQAAGARCARPATLPPRQDLGTWSGEGFRPRSCSDSQAPADPGPCRRMWGHSVSSPSLLEPSEGGAGGPAQDKDGRSHWGRVKELLTRLTRRSLRGGRCR